MSKYQKDWPHDNCDECGSELVVHTDCPDGDLVYDGDPAFCEECDMEVGTVSIDEDGRAWINLF